MSDWHVLPRCFAKMKRLGMVPLQILPRVGALSFIGGEEALRQTNHQNLGLPKVPLNHLSAGPHDLALKEDSYLVTTHSTSRIADSWQSTGFGRRRATDLPARLQKSAEIPGGFDIFDMANPRCHK